MENTLCTVTGRNWTVTYVYLLAVYGEYLKYSYLQIMGSKLCAVTGRIWREPYVHLPAETGQYFMYSY